VEKKIPGSDKIPTWAEDIGMIHDITHEIYNMDMFIPQLSLNIVISPNRNAYILIFSFIENVSYAFLEYLIERYPRIMNVEFNCSGNTTRNMSIIITCNTERKEKTSPVYAKRFGNPKITESIEKKEENNHLNNDAQNADETHAPKKQKVIPPQK
jgi:hypothetical protein